MEQSPAQLQLGPQLQSVAQISVVGKGHFALHMIDHNGLGIGPIGAAGGAVAHVAYGNIAQGILLQVLPVKRVGQQSQVLVNGKIAVAVHHNAAAFLAPMLQGKQAIVADIRHPCVNGRIDTEHAALLM